MQSQASLKGSIPNTQTSVFFEPGQALQFFAPARRHNHMQLSSLIYERVSRRYCGGRIIFKSMPVTSLSHRRLSSQLKKVRLHMVSFIRPETETLSRLRMNGHHS